MQWGHYEICCGGLLKSQHYCFYQMPKSASPHSSLSTASGLSGIKLSFFSLPVYRYMLLPFFVVGLWWLTGSLRVKAILSSIKLTSPYPLISSIKISGFMQMYSTVGDLVPIWRRSKLLKITTTSLRPCTQKHLKFNHLYHTQKKCSWLTVRDGNK